MLKQETNLDELWGAELVHPAPGEEPQNAKEEVGTIYQGSSYYTVHNLRLLFFC